MLICLEVNRLFSSNTKIPLSIGPLSISRHSFAKTFGFMDTKRVEVCCYKNAGKMESENDSTRVSSQSEPTVPSHILARDSDILSAAHIFATCPKHAMTLVTGIPECVIFWTQILHRRLCFVQSQCVTPIVSTIWVRYKTYIFALVWKCWLTILKTWGVVLLAPSVGPAPRNSSEAVWSPGVQVTLSDGGLVITPVHAWLQWLPSTAIALLCTRVLWLHGAWW